jgi:hypothetical protein
MEVGAKTVVFMGGCSMGLQNSCAMAFSLLNSARTVMRFYLHLHEPITDNPVIN